ncbi:hypothetical protein U4960_13565 [Altererythrobacter sp. H2]|uniref:hypothetical protein n=1 Tax=Altererythrobacter sp. H2 TaxID=3108391 RepID=UPI002B4C1EF6|nr:hypothetical protein [Altererythrobacter sp. H2]WRK95308.1 hypothetical protein U4960_13565 [Altererythrobacter sp. H2]
MARPPAKPESGNGLLANPAVAALVTDIALKAGIFVVRRGVDRLLGQTAQAEKPRKKSKMLAIAVPVAAIAGTGALARFLYHRSQSRRERLARIPPKSGR